MDLMMIPLLILCSTPIFWIIGWTMIRITETITGRRIEGGGMNLKLLGRGSSQDTEELKERIENLEAIVTGMDDELLEDLLRSQKINTNKYDRIRLENLARSLRSSQSSNNDSVTENIKAVANKLLKRIETALDEQEPPKRRGFRKF